MAIIRYQPVPVHQESKLLSFRKMGALMYLLCACLGFAFISTPVFSETPTSPFETSSIERISLDSDKGLALLFHSASNPHVLEHYIKLSAQYTTQEAQTYCGVASSVMVLNALQVKPVNRLFDQYSFFNQENFFSDEVLAIVSDKTVRQQGLMLEQLGAALETYPVQVTVTHATEDGYLDFMEQLDEAFRQPNQYLIVNFYRRALNQTGGGHFSPLGAYDKASNRVLIMDVARFRFLPFWVNTHDLWRAMLPVDNTSGLSRGFIRIKGSED